MLVSAARLAIGDDDLVRLTDAPAVFFPAGQMTLSALRTEARKGNLATVRIAGKDFVTRNAVRGMIELCRDAKSRPASKSEARQADAGSGLSGTDNAISAQDALRVRLSAPTKPLRNSSQKASGPTRQNVVRLPSNSAPS